jgi:hypothetical protein
MKSKVLNLGCTKFRHDQIGIHAVINARGGNQHLNNRTTEDIELQRDARNIQDYKTKRIRFYQFNSKHLRKASDVQHLLSSYND